MGLLMNCSSRLRETNTLKLRNGGSPFSRSHCHMVFSSVVSQDIIPTRDSSSSANLARSTWRGLTPHRGFKAVG